MWSQGSSEDHSADERERGTLIWPSHGLRDDGRSFTSRGRRWHVQGQPVGHSSPGRALVGVVEVMAGNFVREISSAPEPSFAPYDDEACEYKAGSADMADIRAIREDRRSSLVRCFERSFLRKGLRRTTWCPQKVIKPSFRYHPVDLSLKYDKYNPRK